MRLRQGRKVGRTLYLQVGEEPSDDDVLVGMVDTPELAGLISSAVNYCYPRIKLDLPGRD